jgi:fructose-1,6-bisphosphatase-3
MLDKINYKDGTITLEGKTYKLKDTNFPTIDPEHPFELTAEEEELMELLRVSFLRSEKLQRHIRFLYEKGSIYLAYNNNLLYHGCIPMNSDGSFTEVTLCGEKVSGKALLDKCEQIARYGYFAPNGSSEKEYGKDFLWFLWCGCYSPVYGKNKMTSFERYFIDDESTWVEIKDEYYRLVEKPSVCDKILTEFGIDKKAFAHIINGHVPVKIKKGESPIKAGGKLLVIDGGLSRAYQNVTGLAGYTLLFNSHGLLLSAHDSFESIESAIKEEKDIHSTLDVVELAPNRLFVEDTDAGKAQSKKIDDLKALVEAYHKGLVKQN